MYFEIILRIKIPYLQSLVTYILQEYWQGRPSKPCQGMLDLSKNMHYKNMLGLSHSTLHFSGLAPSLQVFSYQYWHFYSSFLLALAPESTTCRPKHRPHIFTYLRTLTFKTVAVYPLSLGPKQRLLTKMPVLVAKMTVFGIPSFATDTGRKTPALAENAGNVLV